MLPGGLLWLMKLFLPHKQSNNLTNNDVIMITIGIYHNENTHALSLCYKITTFADQVFTFILLCVI